MKDKRDSTYDDDSDSDYSVNAADVISFDDAFSVANLSEDELTDISGAGSDEEAPPTRREVVTPIAAKIKPIEHPEKIRVVLSETETMVLFTEENTVHAVDDQDADDIVKRNEQYTAVVDRYRLAEGIVERSVQTTQVPMKDRKSATVPIRRTAKQVEANEAEIFDSFHKEDELDEPVARPGPRSGLTAQTSDIQGPDDGDTNWDARSVMTAYTAYTMGTAPSETSMSQTMTMTGVSVTDMAASREQVDSDGQMRRVDTVERVSCLKDSRMLDIVLLAERIIRQNGYRKQHRLWTQFAEAPAKTTAKGSRSRSLSIAQTRRPSVFRMDSSRMRVPGLDTLYYLTGDGTGVTAMDWGSYGTADVLAVATGNLSFTTRPGDKATVRVWTPRNPVHPELIISAPCTVTSLAWSADHNQVLAVGLHDGRVCLYDVLNPVIDSKTGCHVPQLSTSFATQKHQEAVWGLGWAQTSQAATTADLLISVSGDGRVTQRSLKKSLKPTDIMQLRAVATSTAKGGALSKLSSGLCLDLAPDDPNIYLVGTDSNAIHRCSRSYSEQFLSSYTGHQGAVTTVRFSPFMPSLFLSGSADGQAKLWDAEESDPVLDLKLSGPVSAVAWCPFSATIFMIGTRDGTVCMWDLAHSETDPVVTLKGPNTDGGHAGVRAIQFNRSSPVVAVGYDNGMTNLMHLSEVTKVDDGDREGERDALAAIIETMKGE